MPKRTKGAISSIVGNTAAPLLVKGDEESSRADADAHVGHVEGGPVHVPDVEIQKIDHHPEPRPIQQIAQGAAQDQAQSVDIEGPVVLLAPGQDPDQTHGQDRDHDEEGPLPVDVVAVQETKGRSPVQDVHDVEKTGDDREALFPDRNGLLDPELAQLVQKNSKACKQGHEQKLHRNTSFDRVI